jgi:hypothetical protein
MDRAMGIEKASLATVVRLNSCACEIYQNALWGAPVFGNLFGPAANALAFYVELQMHWLTMMMPHANGSAESLLQVTAPGSTVASSSDQQPTAEVLEQCMDIAIGGLETPSSTIASSSGEQAPYGERAQAQMA